MLLQDLIQVLPLLVVEVEVLTLGHSLGAHHPGDGRPVPAVFQKTCRGGRQVRGSQGGLCSQPGGSTDPGQKAALIPGLRLLQRSKAPERQTGGRGVASRGTGRVRRPGRPRLHGKGLGSWNPRGRRVQPWVHPCRGHCQGSRGLRPEVWGTDPAQGPTSPPPLAVVTQH